MSALGRYAKLCIATPMRSAFLFYFNTLALLINSAGA
jgi:hypothetical protein